jgi:glycosyltransferase involved in cell wall biosynthesis
VIPAYNRAGTVGRAIDSALTQTRRPYEIIVVDDGSTDGTTEFLRRLGTSICSIHQSNRGVSGARNAGIRAASGEWIAFLDSDDQWLPNHLAVQMDALERAPQAVAAAANGLIRGAAGTPTLEIAASRRINWLKGEQSRVLSGAAAVLNQPVTSGVIAKREALQRCGGFDPLVREFEDLDLWSKLALCGGWVFTREPGFVLSRSEMGEENVSQQYWRDPAKALQSLLRCHERLLGASDASLLEAVALRRKISAYRCSLAAVELGRGAPRARAHLARSILDWPSVRSIARAGLVAAGWCPQNLRPFLQLARNSVDAGEVGPA